MSRIPFLARVLSMGLEDGGHGTAAASPGEFETVLPKAPPGSARYRQCCQGCRESGCLGEATPSFCFQIEGFTQGCLVAWSRLHAKRLSLSKEFVV